MTSFDKGCVNKYKTSWIDMHVGCLGIFGGASAMMRHNNKHENKDGRTMFEWSQVHIIKI